jgi:hypothetical protein
MSMKYPDGCELLDEEWVMLIAMAKKIGVPKEEILEFFRSKAASEISVTTSIT